MNKSSEKAPFTDTVGNWSEGYVSGLCSANVIIPSEYNGIFGVNTPMTRAEVAKMTVRALGYTDDGSIKTTTFTDNNSISAKDIFYVGKASELEIVNGYLDNTFKPNNPVQRSEASAIILRMIDAKRQAGITLDGWLYKPSNVLLFTSGIVDFSEFKQKLQKPDFSCVPQLEFNEKFQKFQSSFLSTVKGYEKLTTQKDKSKAIIKLADDYRSMAQSLTEKNANEIMDNNNQFGYFMTEIMYRIDGLDESTRLSTALSCAPLLHTAGNVAFKYDIQCINAQVGFFARYYNAKFYDTDKTFYYMGLYHFGAKGMGENGPLNLSLTDWIKKYTTELEEADKRWLENYNRSQQELKEKIKANS